MSEAQAEVQQETNAEMRVEEQPWPELAYQLYSKTRPVPAMIATILFALTALISTIGHFELIRGVTERKQVRRTLKGLVVFTMFLFGCGTGLVIMGHVRTSFRAG